MPAQVPQDLPRLTRARSKATSVQPQSEAIAALKSTPDPLPPASAAIEPQPTRNTTVAASTRAAKTKQPNAEAHAIVQNAPIPEPGGSAKPARPQPKPVQKGSVPAQSDGSEPVRTRSRQEKALAMRMSEAVPPGAKSSDNVPIKYVCGPVPSTNQLTAAGPNQKKARHEHSQSHSSLQLTAKRAKQCMLAALSHQLGNLLVAGLNRRNASCKRS